MNQINVRGGRLLRFSTAGAAVALLGSALAAAPAAAGPVAASAAAPAARSCVVDVTGVTPAACYASFTEAVRAATGGRVTDAPGTAAAALRDKGFEAKVNAAAAQSGLTGLVADTIISIEYMDRDFEGVPQIWTANRGCPDNNLNDVDWEIGDVGWSDNQISSFRGYANCWVKHYQYEDWEGAVVGYHSSRAYIGDAMENRTTSLRWS